MTGADSLNGGEQHISGSFRDPSGFLFVRDGVLYRQVNPFYRDDYDHLMQSGLYEALRDAGALIPHEEVDTSLAATVQAYHVIRPEPVPFISYPYEWSFGQLKDAALLTLEIQKRAMESGMALKDCSAYNVQFLRGRPVFIDTLSFERYVPGQPWVAYRQFCQHFLAPLVLMSRKDIRLSQLLRVYIDGVPLDLASKLLGFRSRLSLSLQIHIHMHAKAQKRYEGKAVDTSKRKVSKLAMLGLIDSLESTIRKLAWRPRGTEWGDYYTFTNYSEDAFDQKKQLIAEFLDQAKPNTVWDLGGNTGEFSRIASERGILTVSFDIDPAAVEKNYRQVVAGSEENILPLVQDLTNPSGGIGWACDERMSLAERGPAGTVMALTLIHHLAISNNVPLPKVAKFLSGLCRTLIIEFVPKENSQVQKLLATREDVFPEYEKSCFERDFRTCFTIDKSVDIPGTERTLYLMRTTDT